MTYSDIKLTDTSYCKNLTISQPTNGVSVDINGQTLTVAETVTIDAGETFRFYDWDSESTDMDNGKIIVGTDLMLAGAATQQLEINNLDFEANGGTATYCTVTNSQNTGATDIDATSETNVDGGSNSGWDFGTVVEVVRYILGIFKSKLFQSTNIR